MITDANVLTMDSTRPRARWLAIAQDRVVALGPDPGDAPRCSRTVKLDGATVVPGFHDAHVHSVLYGRSLSAIDLRSPGVSNLEALYRKVREAASREPAGTWLIGQGYDQDKLGGHPKREKLDEIAPDHFVRLDHVSRHMCVVNSRVLSQLRISKEEGNTASAGLLREEQMELLGDHMGPVPLEQMVTAIERSHGEYLREGLTAVQEAGIGGGLAGSSPSEPDAFRVARQRGKLPVRTSLMPAGTMSQSHVDEEDFGGLGPGMGAEFGDLQLRIGAMKLFGDGSMIGRTAAMYEPYADDPHNCGDLALEPGRLQDFMLRAHRGGWQLATHAVGDRAVDTVIECYRRCLEEVPRMDHRHRIEHAGVVSDGALAQMASLGIIANPQGRFIFELGDGFSRALGSRRMRSCYRGKSLLASGIELPGSSDRPVVDGAPLKGIHDLVNRRTQDGEEVTPTESLTAFQALRAYTYGSAYATFLEGDMGSLAPGKLADVAVLSDDVTRIQPERIREIEVLATVIGGSVAFEKQGLALSG